MNLKMRQKKNYQDWETEKNKDEGKLLEARLPVEHPDINQHIHCGSLGKEREKGEEHFTNFMKDLNINIQAFQQTPSKMNSKRATPRHIIIKFLKIKD